LAEALVGAGHEVDVLTAGMSDLAAEEMIGGVRVLRVPGWRRQRHYSTALEQASYMWPMLRQGLQLTAARRHDLVHAHFVVPTGIVARRIARRQGIPYVVTAHGSDVPGYNPDRFALLHQVIGRAWRAVLADAAAVTSPSAFVRELIRRRAKAAVEVIPNPYDAAGPASLPKRRRVLTVARLVQRKGVQHLIAALGGLEQDVECVIAGDGPLRPELEAMARRQGLAIEFTGFIGREALAELYASAAIFVLPSLQENFPMVLLEAMNAGCAVVTTDHPGCLEVVGKGRTDGSGHRRLFAPQCAFHAPGRSSARDEPCKSGSGAGGDIRLGSRRRTVHGTIRAMYPCPRRLNPACSCARRPQMEFSQTNTIGTVRTSGTTYCHKAARRTRDFREGNRPGPRSL
jgi:glycosyltransferase involved in cell wall biosynthesis